VREWAGAEDEPNAKYAKAFFYKDPDKADQWGGYKLGFADVIDDELKAVPRGIFAVAGVLNGARGGADIPDEDVEKIKKRVETWYAKMAKEFDDDSIVVPWKDEKKMKTEGQKRSGFFSDEMEECTTDVYFLTGVFLSGYYDLCYAVRTGALKPEEIDAALAEGLDEFKQSCVEALGPKLQEMAAAGDDDDDFFYYSLGMARAVAAFKAVSADVLAHKSGARNSEADLDLLNKAHEMTAKAHDNLVDLGVECSKHYSADMDEGEAEADKGVSLAETTMKAAQLEADNASLREEKETLEKQLKETKDELDLWEASGPVVLEALRQYSRQPLPRAGVVGVSHAH
jgi:hypothetical protein